MTYRPGAALVLAAGLAVGAGSCASREADVGGASKPAGTEGAEGTAKVATMPSPFRERMFEAVRLNEGCVRCHPGVAAEWQGSLHQRAEIEPAYRRSFAIEPLPFCRSCHAPEAIATEEAPESVAAIGVGCVTCHVTEGDAVLASPKLGSEDEASPHPIRRSQAFATSAACKNCHEFPFPTALGRRAEDLMQTTIMEHQASPAADRSCADCHMPPILEGERRRSHAFAASRDPSVVKSAVNVTAERLDARTVRVVLTPIDPGHAFPTGDLFRRLEVWAEAAGPDDMSLSSAHRYLTRHWGFRPGAAARSLLSDDRVHSEPVAVTLDVGDPGLGRDIVWRVAYQRVAHPKGIDEADAEIEAEIVLGSGRFPPP